jgi:DNA replication protein DnaC
MHQDWLNSFACGLAFPYVPSLKSCNLLIIDDFGTAEMSKDFLAFFMELIDYRMQWKKRGTVITTNLNDDKLIEFCGEPMCDRFNTGQTFIFEGKTRRKSKPI